MTIDTVQIALPPAYRAQDVLRFHGRDTERTAEQVGDGQIRKGVMIGDVPVVLDVTLSDTHALCRIDADTRLDAPALAQAHAALRSVLGLRLDPAPFIDFVKDDALFGPLTQRQGPLRVVQSASVFEALTWAIIGQQINLSFAIALRRTFILQAGRQHGSGLWCYPDAHDAARLDVEALTSRKFSRAKADTVLRLAQLVERGELDLSVAEPGDIARLSSALLAVKGIGPWTVNYALLRGMGYADCSLHGDVAVRAALGRLLGEADKPDMARTERILAAYAPHRTMAAAHLWASLHSSAA